MKIFLKIMRVSIKLVLLGYVFAVNIFLLAFFYLFLLALVKLFSLRFCRTCLLVILLPNMRQIISLFIW